MVQVTSRELSATVPTRLIARHTVSGTAFRVAHHYWPKNAAWNRPGKNILFMTCFHVVESAEGQKCRLRCASHGPGSWVSGKICYAIPTLDFALIAVDLEEEEEDHDEECVHANDPFVSAPASILEDTVELELLTSPIRAQQQKVFCVGFPLGYLECYVSSGEIGGRNSGHVCDDYFSLDLSLNSGAFLELG